MGSFRLQGLYRVSGSVLSRFGHFASEDLQRREKRGTGNRCSRVCCQNNPRLSDDLSLVFTATICPPDSRLPNRTFTNCAAHAQIQRDDSFSSALSAPLPFDQCSGLHPAVRPSSRVAAAALCLPPGRPTSATSSMWPGTSTRTSARGSLTLSLTRLAPNRWRAMAGSKSTSRDLRVSVRARSSSPTMGTWTLSNYMAFVRASCYIRCYGTKTPLPIINVRAQP